MLDTLKTALQFVISNVAYPFIIVGVVALVMFMSVRICLTGFKDGSAPWHEVVRRAVSALLPYVILIFLTESGQGNVFLRVLEPLLTYIGPWAQFGLGLAAGGLAVELARAVLSLRNNVGDAVAAFYFSVLGATLLLALMRAGFGGIQVFLFGFVLAGGFDIMFFGVPVWREKA